MVSVVSFSQNTNPTDSTSVVKKDSVPLKYNFNYKQNGGLFLNNPSKTYITFDKALGKFVLVEKIGDVAIGTPLYLSPREYEKYRLKNDIKGYFREKINAGDSRKKGNSEAKRNLLPKYYVNSKFFESVFGGNAVEVIPSGQLNIKLGAIYQKTENPQVSIENQSSFTFDFDQQITASLQAKVGKRLKVTANYDTQSTFDFQNVIKLEYTPTEDDIIRSIDAGNISMPIKNSLINGAQSLFGVKTELQFGKTFITAAFSQQNSQSKTVVAEGGSRVEPFELRASDYDNDRHFFVSQYFRENYNKALRNYPLINSPVNITRIEVWVTNRTQDVTDYRSIVALADLGESNSNATSDNLVNNEVADLVTPVANVNGINLPYNEANRLRTVLDDPLIRDVGTVDNAIDAAIPGVSPQQGFNYSYLQNARRLQQNRDFTLHPQLGYISLNRRLNDGEVLAVAFEYTVVGASNGETVFKVGEFSNDGIVAPENIVVKLLRSEILNTVRPNTTTTTSLGEPFPTWRLMMKNIYAIGAYPLRQEGFRFELMYRDDATGTLQNTLQNASTAGVDNRPLMQLIGLDKLDASQYAVPNGDGYFDFVEGATVNSEKGYIIFPETEPFGVDLENKLNTVDQEKYMFENLYLTTKIQAKNDYQDRDKFFLKGYFKSEASRGISLGAFNIPRGSVSVTAGGRQLVEGVDYVVDYQLGRVQILDPGLEASGVPINATVENNTFFNQQRKTFMGIDIEHRFSEQFKIGATVLNVSEKPITPKVNFGGEPINNTMLGFNVDYSSEVPYLTKLANKLPFVETEVPSNVSVRGDFAYLLPGSPSGINVDGTATAYLDDFEASQIPIDLSSPQQWFLASTPDNFNGNQTSDLSYNYNRAKLAWYNIDQLFYGSGNRPANINENELSRNEVRQIRYNELLPNTDLDLTQQNLVRTLDLAFYPNERGQYNFNQNFDGLLPENKWGGVMRALTTNNFEQSNVEYIQFWLMNPYEEYTITEEEGLPAGVDPTLYTNMVGDLFFNLGNISEDILRDNRKQYENGLPTDQTPTQTETTVWGKVPANPSILYAFGSEGSERTQQDIGLDGLNDEEELENLVTLFPNIANVEDARNIFGSDPAKDNFHFFRGGSIESDDPSILTRYKRYNGSQGNSPTVDQSTESYPTSGSTYPDTEDINRDQTMNPVNSYFEYKVSLNGTPNADTGLPGLDSPYIVDSKRESITLANGSSRATTWYQFRIPVKSGTPIGGITDFNSIRFMRMYMSGFKMPVVLRFGQLELVRGDWRRYTKVLLEGAGNQGQQLDNDDLNNFEVGVVSIEQNDDKYELPPGIQREELQSTNRIQRQNEQSATLKVTDLEPNDLRTIYKNISIDMRRYKNLRMFLHAEKITDGVTKPENGEIKAVIRLGTDLTENYYEIEKPLNLSEREGVPSPLGVWPEANNLDVITEDLSNLKLLRPDGDFTTPYEAVSSNGLVIRVKGNPTLAQIRTVMLGVKNTAVTPKSVEVWFNELRAIGFDNKGGWAATINADANLADVMDISLAGSMSTVGFGNVEDRVQQRSIEDVKLYSVATNVQLGKMMPKKWNMQIPMSFSYGEEFRNPKYDPQMQDVTIDQARQAANTSEQAQRNLDNAEDYTSRKSISFINVKKNRNPESKKKPRFYDIENVSVSYSHSEEFHRDYNIEKFENKTVSAGVNYSHNFQPKVFQPFKKSEKLKSKYLKFLRDFNLSLLPKSIAINSRIDRNYISERSRNLVEGLSPQPELVQRRFLFNWDYAIAYDLTKSLQFNFNATNSYIYDTFGNDEELEVYDQFFNIGRRDKYHQTLNSTYKLPIDKLPFLGFIKADYGYTADFDWQAGAQSTLDIDDGNGGNIQVNYADVVGNMIQNANTHNLNVNIDFNRFYKTLKLDKLLLKGARRGSVKKTGKGKNATTSRAKLKKNASFGQKLMKGTYDVLTSVKKMKISYSENNGTLLQGYTPSVDFLGVDYRGGEMSPGLGFVFGSQTDILHRAIENGWLVTRDPNTPEGANYYSKNYGKTSMEKLDYNISVKPFRSLSIDFRANRIKTTNLTQQLDVVPDGNGGFHQDPNIKPYETGNFSMSYFMLGTMFTDGDKLYDTFLKNREIIGDRLAAQTGYDRENFKNTGQQVMLPAFLAAYGGQSASSVKTGIFRNIPIPNWTLRYNGFMKYKWFKKNFTSFTISHGYKSSYTIGGFTNNLQYEGQDPLDEISVDNQPALNATDNFQPQQLVSSATLIDEFSPLIKVDFKLKSSLSFKGEIKRDRNLSLNFNNNTLTDIKGTEFIVGFGYKIRDVKFVTRFTGKKETLKGDINLRADISLRDNLTLIRSIDQENSQITGGERLFSFKFLADYNLSKDLTASFYYNHQTFSYAISTTFPRQAINAGFSLVYNLGN